MQGIKLLVKINGNVAAGQSNATLDRDVRIADVTNLIELNWSEYLTQQKSWRVSANGAYIFNDTAMSALGAAYVNGEPVNVELNDGITRMYGEAIITSYPLGAPYNQEQTYRITLQGTGALTTEAIE